MKEPLDVVITVNSPGEVSGWLKPVSVALEHLPWESRITVFIPPCPFASGAEAEVVKAIPQVDKVIGAKETIRYTLTGKLPKGFYPSECGIVLFLGGDLTYAALLGKRLHYPAVAYTEGLVNWEKSFARFAVPYHYMAEKIKKDSIKKKTRVIGNLMLDAVKPSFSKEKMKQVLGNQTSPGLLLMPGSRPAHFHYMLVFFLKAAEIIKSQMPDLIPAVSISPFVSKHQLIEAISGSIAKAWGLSAVYIPGEDKRTSLEWQSLGQIKTSSGVNIPCFRGHQYDLMNWADLALTIPGTNTIELSFMGVPMIVTVPLNHPEEIPLEGIAGIIGRIPVLGKELKRRLLPKVQAKIKFTAWPNRLAGKLITPELIGGLSPDEVAKVAIDMLKNRARLLNISKCLRETVGESGAAQRLTDLLQEVITEYYVKPRP
jgi:lipid-A-disaccharide synthase